MSLSVFATADVHLGMKFSSYGDAGAVLAEARFAALSRCVELANERRSDLFAIAGDLFDRPRVARSDVERAARILDGFEGAAVLVLPGNHDYLRAGVDTLWSGFRDSAGDRTLLLAETRVYDLSHYDVQALVYAAPCDSKHSPTNRIAWVPDAVGVRSNEDETTGGAVRIGIAHGSIAGLTLDSEGLYFPMSKDSLSATGLDLWIVGHTHVPHFDPSTGVVVPGTPEPDGFDCRHAGSGAEIRLAAAERPAADVDTVPTGRYVFSDANVRLDPAGDLVSQLRPEGDPGRTVARVTVSGVLPAGVYEEYLEVRRSVGSDYLSYDLRDDAVHRELSRSDIDARYPEQSFAHQLLTDLFEAADTPALDEAQRLLDEARS